MWGFKLKDSHAPTHNLGTSLAPDLRFIREDIKAMHAYVVQDAKGMLKLDAMENPFSLSPELGAKLEIGRAHV